MCNDDVNHVIDVCPLFLCPLFVVFSVMVPLFLFYAGSRGSVLLPPFPPPEPIVEEEEQCVEEVEEEVIELEAPILEPPPETDISPLVNL